MFKEMRRKDKKLNMEESIALLKKANYGILSLSVQDSFGYGVPLNYAYENGVIYFHCAKEGQKLDYIKKNNKVSFCVVDSVELLPSKFDTNYKSVIIFGEACEVIGEEKKNGLMALINKYSKDFINEGANYIEKAQDKIKVVKIEITHITGKGQQ